MALNKKYTVEQVARMIVNGDGFWDELREEFTKWTSEDCWTHAAVLREIRIAVETHMPGYVREVDKVSRYLGDRLVPPVDTSLPMKFTSKYFIDAMNIGRRMLLGQDQSRLEEELNAE